MFVPDLDPDIDLERQALSRGLGAYALFPITHGAGREVLAALLVAFRERSGRDGLDVAVFTEVASSIGASVGRGLLASQRERALKILEASGDALIAWDREGRVEPMVQIRI